MVVSQKKLDANRANAQKSTGPRTAGGKCASSRNAATHGLWANFLLPGESAEAFGQIRNGMILSLNPRTPFELDLLDRAAALAWRLRRIENAEAGLLLTTDLELAQKLRQHVRECDATP